MWYGVQRIIFTRSCKVWIWAELRCFLLNKWCILFTLMLINLIIHFYLLFYFYLFVYLSIYLLIALVKVIFFAPLLTTFIDYIHWLHSLTTFIDYIHWLHSLTIFIDYIHWLYLFRRTAERAARDEVKQKADLERLQKVNTKYIIYMKL